jgi:tetratricopeptide (TPR) repeat protein
MGRKKPLGTMSVESRKETDRDGRSISRRLMSARIADKPRKLRQLRFHRDSISTLTQDVSRSLREGNKLIFVQEFQKASKLLKKLSENHPFDFEIQARRIEVLCRMEQMEGLEEELNRRLARQPHNLTLQLAALLASLRNLEKKYEEEVAEELVNPSLSLQRRDVVGLSTDAERAAVHERARNVYTNLGATLGVRTPSSSQGLLRLTRNPSVADDATPQELGPLEEAYADGKSDIALAKQEERIHDPLVAQAQKLKQENPNSFAAWYVAGCALEYSGDLAEAVECWTHALTLNPVSLAVLSTLSELQQIGALPQDTEDYTARFENLDVYLVHGSFDTHVALYKEYLNRGEHTMAIAALRTLADWTQKQRGEVPAEIEALSLLGAMKAYRLAGNHTAAEACRREAENIVIAAKKGGESPAQLSFLGQLAEEYGLPPLARICYFSVLNSVETPRELAIRTAAHCVSVMPSHALKEVLQTTYTIHQGHPELRFCLLLCSLGVGNVPIKRYMERRAKARAQVQAGEWSEALGTLGECLREVDEDAEIQKLMGEVLWRVGKKELSSTHFARMYWLDSLNPDIALTFVSHLVKLGEFARADVVAKQSLEIPTLNNKQLAELSWVRATSLAQAGKKEEARIQMNKALGFDPWNPHYMGLALRLMQPLQDSQLLSSDFVYKYERMLEEREPRFSDALLEEWLAAGRKALKAGFVELAWTLSRCAFLYRQDKEEVVQFYATCGAAWNSRAAVQQTLVLLTKGSENSLGFSSLSTAIARIYSCSGEWALVAEWLDISIKSGLEDKILRSRVFEMEALALAMQGVEYARAQALVEAALDVYESSAQVPQEVGVLHGYLMMAQGEIRQGLEKMRGHLKDAPGSILSLYFLVKGLHRAGKLKGQDKEHVNALFALAPVNSLERLLVEEIYSVVGLNDVGRGAHLTN